MDGRARGPSGIREGNAVCVAHECVGLTALSTGDLARQAAREATDRGRVVRQYMNAGALLPDALVCELLCEAIASTSASSRGLLFDGYPRTDGQARRLDESLLARPLDVYVDLRVDDDVLLERLAGRGRSDDHDLAVLRRLDEFDRWTRPMIERLRREGRVVTVDGAQPPAVVHRAITSALGQYRRRAASLST